MGFKSQRARRPPVGFGVDEFANTTEADHIAYVSQIKEPVTIEEARAGEHSKQRKEAADSEYESQIKNEAVDLPEGREAIGSKWVFN